MPAIIMRKQPKPNSSWQKLKSFWKSDESAEKEAEEDAEREEEQTAVEDEEETEGPRYRKEKPVTEDEYPETEVSEEEDTTEED